MTRELHDVQSKVETRQKVPCGGFAGINVLVGPWVPLIKVLDEKKQLPEPSLVKHAQQIWKRNVFCSVICGTRPAGARQGSLQITWSVGLFVRAWDFVQLPCFVHVAAADHLEVHVACDFSVDQDLHQLTWCMCLCWDRQTERQTQDDLFEPQSWHQNVSQRSGENPHALTAGKKEFGDEVNVPLFSTAQILSRSLNLKPLVQL